MSQTDGKGVKMQNFSNPFGDGEMTELDPGPMAKAANMTVAHELVSQ